MDAKIICLDMQHLSRARQSRISQKIYGYIDSSNHGKYKYSREGILSAVSKIILGKASFIIYRKDSYVINEIEKLGAVLRVYDISIKKWD